MPLTPYNTNLPPHLRALKEEIEGFARGYGLDFFETIFEVVDADDLNEIASYGGFPTRYPHWSFGMAYEELRKSYEYGLSKIYELVINNDPCYAYLMRSNHDVDQKLVMAHVYGHCLAPETLIKTRQGVKTIPSVRVGEEVATHTGAWKAVTACAERHYSGSIIRLSVGGDVVRITPEHPVYVLRQFRPLAQSRPPHLPAKEWTTFWVPANQVVVGDRLILATSLPALPDHLRSQDSGLGCFRGSSPPDVFPPVLAIDSEPYHGLVYNFSVADDESYTLANGVIVHNCDFFKNNAYFSHTNRKMMDEMANHGARIRGYAEKYGEDEVEAFMDKCMSIDDLIDIHSPAIRRRPEVSRYDFAPEHEQPVQVTRFKSKTYMDDYINPRELLKKEEEQQRKQREETARSFPEHPEKDVLLFLLEYAPLKGWQRDILSIVRDEAYYFAPQGQTKVMNEGWACINGNSYVQTTQGFLTARQLVDECLQSTIHDGEAKQRIYDWARFEERETVTIRTRRGLELGGSRTHRVLVPDGTWKRLDELSIGDRVQLAVGGDLWATAPYHLDWQPKRRGALREVAQAAGVSFAKLSYRRYECEAPPEDGLTQLLAEYDRTATETTIAQNRRKAIRIPEVVDERLAAFLGYLIGDGHISAVKRVIGLTTGDQEQAETFAGLVRDLFGLEPRIKRDGNRLRVLFSSADLRDFLLHLGLEAGPCARRKTIPECILRSPKAVVAAFLRALYDCDGYAGKAGVILSTSSDRMSEVVQIVLLNFGILSRRRKHKDGCWHVHTMGASAKLFCEQIGFGLTRKQEALREYVGNRQWFKAESHDDEIVAIEHGRDDVYDFSVENTHRYVAQGFINHNSYWHSTIMTQKVLLPSEVVDYADHHSGTMAMSGGRLNPYKIGIELLRDVEFRWNTGRFGKEYDECDDLERKRKWNLDLGLGRKKIFEVRRVHNDLTFIDTFLTPEFCVQHRLFTFAWQEQAGQYFIESRDFAKIKERLLFSLTNFGKPWIYVVDGNFRNRGELLLRHLHNGVDLRQDHAQEVLANLQFIWGRPVHVHTLVENKPALFTYDGTEHSIKTGGDIDDPRRHTPPKSR
jgi:stage V sporulation protein R